MQMRRLVLATCVAGFASMASFAQSVLHKSAFETDAQALGITQANQVDIDLLKQVSKKPQACGTLCIAPIKAAPDVKTIGELDVMRFMNEHVKNETGLLIDGRAPQERQIGFLPSSINIPYFIMADDNPNLNDILVVMGASNFTGTLDFTDAKPIVVFDGGPTTLEASELINTLISKGYPAEKINYYRGGIQVWTALGLNVEGTSL